jgi:hypothetical protein
MRGGRVIGVRKMEVNREYKGFGGEIKNNYCKGKSRNW